MRLPERIPVGARVVVRITDGVDEYTGRHQYRDYVGHVRAWDGRTLQLTRDAAANGTAETAQSGENVNNADEA